MKLVRRLSVGLLVVVTLALVTSCAASSGPLSIRQAVRASARLALKERSADRKRLAVAADGGGDIVRLGLVPRLADAAGLFSLKFRQTLVAALLARRVRCHGNPHRRIAIPGVRIRCGVADPPILTGTRG